MVQLNNFCYMYIYMVFFNKIMTIDQFVLFGLYLTLNLTKTRHLRRLTYLIRHLTRESFWELILPEILKGHDSLHVRGERVHELKEDQTESIDIHLTIISSPLHL